ncbi:hypothetical protein JMJ77_0007087 [Colletotrichum scovillei]|uniref:Uncharacterized protein n=1 Tax=Colletotrichum scovillei TaxID=1209932 RepID=A0A9P7UFH8_9PEZI|nr:hypothetical protein JMJ77_0007087 [Colletotrichum scovillei]KAG7074017.1 hypothetical protein JMJ76_0010507 [Colletotrichum scovillei]KAG7080986.1 hypothetical protein JMJ78_0003118 [Colletotrichum scovillei]
MLENIPLPFVIKSDAGATLTTVEGITLTLSPISPPASLEAPRDAIIAAGNSDPSLDAMTEPEAELSETIKGRFPASM